MNQKHHSERDDLEDLLSRDAENYPVTDPAWFAARVTSMARQTPQDRGVLGSFTFLRVRLRWLLPLPLAGFAAVALFLTQHHSPITPSNAFTSTDSEFEQNMELLASNDSLLQE